MQTYVNLTRTVNIFRHRTPPLPDWSKCPQSGANRIDNGSKWEENPAWDSVVCTPPPSACTISEENLRSLSSGTIWPRNKRNPAENIKR